MDAAELRALQAPLKEKYRAEPAEAMTPLHAGGDFSTAGITAVVSTWAGPVRSGLHPATGGDGSDSCSGDMLLQAVLACAGVTMRSVATAMGIELRGATLRADALFDARGTLGVSREVPVGIQPFPRTSTPTPTTPPWPSSANSPSGTASSGRAWPSHPGS
jgi:hypothetical protein